MLSDVNVFYLRFALDRKDVGTSSEEEVWEEGSIPTTSNTNATTLITTSGVNRRKVSSGSDTEEEIERQDSTNSLYYSIVFNETIL